MAYSNLDELRDRYKDRLLGPEAPQVETDATDFTTIVDKYKDRILSPAETAAKEPGTKGAPDEGTPTLGAPALSLPKPAMPETAPEPVKQAEPMTVKPPVARQKPQKKELAKYDPRRLIPSRIRKKLADRSSRMEEEIKLFEDRVNKTGKGIVGGTIVPIAKGVGVAGIKTAGGLIEFLATSPGLVAQPVFKDAESKKEFYRKIEITKLARFGKWLSKYGDEAAELLEQMKPTKNLFEVQEGTWKPKVNTEYLTDPEYWIDTFLQTGSTVAGAIVAGGGTIAGCALVGALMEAAPMYSEMKEDGMNNTDASARAIAFGVIVNQLEKIGFGKMLKKAPKGALGRMLHIATTAGVEALTEYAEEPSGAFLKYMFADEDASAEEEFMRVLDAAIQGLNVLPGSFLTGGAMASVSPTARQQTEREAGGEAQVQGREAAKKRRPHDLFSGEERKGVLGPTEKGQLVTQEQKILFGKTKPRATKFTMVEHGTRGGYVSSPTESEVKAVLIADAAAGHPVSAHAEALIGIISPEEIDTWVDSLPEGVRDGVIPMMVEREREKADPTAPAEGALDAPIDTDVDAKQATEVIEAQAGLREDGTIGVSNAEASRIREMAGLEEFTETESKALMTSMANAKAKGLDLRAESIAESIKKTPRTLNDEEKMGIALREAQLVNQHEQLMTEIDDLTKNDQYADAKVLSKELEGIEEKIELLTDATKFASREWGRSGRASQALIDLGTYDLAKTLVRAKANKGAKLTQKQRDAVAVAIKERDEVQAKLDKFQDQFDPKVLKAFIKESKSVVNEELALVRKRRRLAPNLAKREAKVKEQLRKMGARVNDITGLPIEMTYLIGQLAQIKIEKGARKLQDVVDQIKADLPEISDKDVYESIAGRGKKTKKHLITETQKRSRDLKAQAGAMSDIMAILDGDEKAATQAKTQPSAELKSLSAIRTHLRKINRGLSQTAITASLHQRDEIRYQQIMTKIEAARQQLEEGYRVTKKQPRQDPALIKMAKHTLREIKDLMKTEDALAKADGLIQKIKDGDFTDVDIPAPRAKRLISQELDNARVDLRMKKKAIKEYLESIKPMPWYKKAGGVALTLPRAMMASADVSTLLRQNIMFSYGHPIKAAKYNVKAIKAMFSDRTSEAIQMSMEADPAYKLAERSNMQFEDLDGPLSKQTEDLTSKVLDKIVILNKTVGPLIKGSARHMITFGNLVKLDYFKAALKANPNMNPEQQRDVAEKISLLTGRPARIGPKGSPISGQGLGVLGFAPKFAWSRLAAPGTVAAGIANPASRKFMVTEMARSATSFLVIMQLAMMMGYDIEDDPESSMFGRVKMGNTWIDMSGGIIPTFQKMIIAPILIGRHKWTKAPEGSARKKMSRELHSRYLRSQGTMDPWLQWLKYKNGPTVSIPMTMWSGENVIGQKQSVGETVLRSMVPLVIQEATQIAQDQLLNLLEKIVVIALAAAGASPTTIQNEMMSPDISRILRKGDVGRVAPPTWKGANVPTWLHTDGRRQKEFDEQFYSRMAAIVRGMDIEDSTQKEIQEDIRDYAKVLRAEMKAEVSKLKKPKGDE